VFLCILQGFNAKLSDFGLVIDAPPGDKTHLSLSKVLGTYGYVDPAYLASGNFYHSSYLDLKVQILTIIGEFGY